MRLSWALVHSRQTEDVHRGIAMLECKQKFKSISLSLSTPHTSMVFPLLLILTFAASLGSTTSPLKLREKLYLLAVGYYRSGDYSRSRELVEDCLKV